MPSENDMSWSEKSKKRKVDDDTDLTAKKKKRASLTSDAVKTVDWTDSDLMTLVENIEKIIPSNDTLHYKARNGKLNYTKAAFDGYSAEECQQKWMSVCQQARNFTKLTFLIPVIKDMIQNKHPDMPKQPKTPYMRFYCEKFSKVKEENPDLSIGELAKIISKLYADLKEKKKGKYTEAYLKDKAAYDEEMKRIMLQHPDLYKEKNKSAKPRRVTPQSLFIDHSVQKAKGKDSTINVKEASELFRKKWSTLKDKKKLKWIQMAAEAEKKTDNDEMNSPDVKKEEKRSILTKAEQRIKDKADGKPEKPVSSGYQLFTTEMMHKLAHISNKDRFKESASRWKSLSDQERATYNEKAKKGLEKYNSDVQTYIDSLPEEERAKASDSFKPKKSSSSVKSKGGKGSEKSLTAEIFFIDDQKEAYKKLHPELDDYHIITQLIKKFDTLSKFEKEKYLSQSYKEQEQKKITDFFNTSDSAEGNTSSLLTEDEEVFSSARGQSQTHTKIKEKKSPKKRSKKDIQKSAAETKPESPKKSPVKKVKHVSSSDSSSDSDDERAEAKTTSKNAKKSVKRKSPVKQVKKEDSSSSSTSSDSGDKIKTVSQSQQTKKLSPKKLPVKQQKKQNDKDSSSSSTSSDSEDEKTTVVQSQTKKLSPKKSPVKQPKKQNVKESSSSSSSSDSEEETETSGSKGKITPAKQLSKQNVKTMSRSSSSSSSDSD